MHRAGVDVSKLVEKARRLYLTTTGGIKDAQMAKILGVSHRTANRYRQQLGATETFTNSFHYTLKPSAEEIEFATELLKRVGLRVEEDYIDAAELEARLLAEERLLEEDF